MWWIKIRAKGFRFAVPLPAYVLSDLLLSLADLGEVILPRLGKPNYLAAAYALFQSLKHMPTDMPLVAIDTEDVYIHCKRLGWGGENP